MSRRKEINLDAVLQTPRGAAYITGLSVKAIRQGCRDGSVPCMMQGSDYKIHMQQFLKQLENECSLMKKQGGNNGL